MAAAQAQIPSSPRRPAKVSEDRGQRLWRWLTFGPALAMMLALSVLPIANLFLTSFQTLGANAVPMAFSELFSALETKTVDGQENPFNTILSSKFYEVQKYMTVTNHVYSPWIVTVSKKWWDQLSKDEQKVLMDAAKISRDFERKDTRDEAAKAVGDLKAKGMQVNELSPAESARMREKLTAVNAGIAANVGEALWKEVQGAVAQARAGK